MKTRRKAALALLATVGCGRAPAPAVQAPRPPRSVESAPAPPPAAAVVAAPATPPGAFAVSDLAGLAVGASSLHAWTRDGAVWRCEMDIGVAPPFRSLARVEGIPPVDEVVAGDRAVCARARGDGAVWCWREADRFHREPARPTPERVADLAGVRDLAAGGETLCAVTSDGAVTCWGDVTFGGPGARLRRVPARVPRSDGAVEVSVGASHACLRRSDGAVRCWGDNAWGELGAGRRRSATPVVVRDIVNADLVVVSHAASCARAAGRVLCWGAGYDGVEMISDLDGPVSLVLGATTGTNENSAGSTWDYNHGYAIARMPDGNLRTWSTHVSSLDRRPGEIAVEDRDERVAHVAMWSDANIDGPFDGLVCVAGDEIQCWSHEGDRVPATNAPRVPFAASAASR